MAQHDLPELLYIYDAYCGWCYGMSPVLLRVQEAFSDRLTVNVLSGGMLTGEQAEPIGEGWDYISQAMPQVERATGVQFGEAYKQLGAQGTYWQDSEAPARALYVFRQLDELQRVLPFAHDVQRALFWAGRDLNQAATYEPLVETYRLPAASFRRLFDLPETAAAVQQEFGAVRRIGVQGFPTVILRVGAQGYVLARGFQPYDVFVAGLEQALAQAEEEQTGR
ncbi:DsbA family protein [Hymenobacter weizhouensis]|uniref:DsbA family protein n=1 Tax=Hymenobacter sp. YIM 151500-1 TaxID=2987689 RepID=UPI002227BA7F|nr:DsbA family protein [Hymenobacter sp. YIM 151500-1]UYZ63180.1 DsbA family protein [Hymenobacter sp. YIM 151500-1]